MLTLRRLEYFVAVAEERHFGQAADVLRVAQPAVSQQIKLLERELGVILVDRSTRPLTLTAAGVLLLREARALLRSVTTMERRVRQVASGVRGPLQLGIPANLPRGMLQSCLRPFTRQHPDVDVATLAYSTERALSGLTDGTLDVALVRRLSPDTALRCLALRHEQLGVAVPAAHPLTERNVLRASDMTGARFVVPQGRLDGTFEQWVFDQLRMQGLEHWDVVEANEPGAAHDIVEAGLGLWITYERAVRQHGGSESTLAWRPLDSLVVTLSAAWPQPPSPVAERFISTLTPAAADPVARPYDGLDAVDHWRPPAVTPVS